MDSIPIIYTERLILRPWMESDLEDMYEYSCDERVGPYAGWAAHKSILEAKQALARLMNDRMTESRAIVLKSEGRAIGNIGIHNRSPRRPRWGRVERELGYVLNPRYWGNEYAPEAARAVMNYCFAVKKVDTLWCGHYKFNENSRKVIEKLGFKLEIKRQEMLFHMDDRVENAYYYKMDRREYISLYRNGKI